MTPAQHLVLRQGLWRQRRREGVVTYSGAGTTPPSTGGGTGGQVGGGGTVVARPSGPGYVRYEDLYRLGDTPSQVVAKVTGGQVLTFPEGIFEWTDFGQGYVDSLRLGNGGYTGCRGLAGTSRNTIFRVKAASSTKGSSIASISSSSGTNPAYVININRMNNCEFRNFRLQGTDQGHEYNGIRIDRCNDALISDLFLDGASPGSANMPPGETFGINVYMSPRARMLNTEVDGRHPVTRARWCASPVGWNDTTDAYVENCYFHHSKAGMPTWWETQNVEVIDTTSYANGSGGGSLNGQAFNFERAWGRIRLTRCTFKPWGKWEQAKGNTHPDVTTNSGLHISLNNDQHDMPDVLIEDPVHDQGPHSSGAFAVYIADTYIGGQMVTTWPTIKKGGVTLQGRMSNNTSGVAAGTHYVVYE